MLWKRIQLVRTIRIMDSGVLLVWYEETGHDQGPVLHINFGTIPLRWMAPALLGGRYANGQRC